MKNEFPPYSTNLFCETLVRCSEQKGTQRPVPRDIVVADKSSTKTVEEGANDKGMDQRQTDEVLLSILFYLRWRRGGFRSIKKVIVIRGSREASWKLKNPAENWEFDQRQMKGPRGHQGN